MSLDRPRPSHLMSGTFIEWQSLSINVSILSPPYRYLQLVHENNRKLTFLSLSSEYES